MQHPFMIKTLSQLGIDRNYLNLVRSMYKKTKGNIILNDERLDAVLQILRTRQEWSL